MDMISIILGNIRILYKVLLCKLSKRKEYVCVFPQKIAHDTVLKIKKGKMSLGRRIWTKRKVYLSVVKGGTLEIGESVFFNQNCIVICQDHISIGKGTIFGPNVCIYDHDHLFDDKKIYGECRTNPVTIGSGCWIGSGAIILKGSKIGEGSVIGAGTIVKGTIPPHSLVTSDRQLVIIPIKTKR